MSSNFWETIWQILVVFVLVAYLIVLFQIIVDLFRDKKLGGFSKAIWFIGLIFLPFLIIDLVVANILLALGMMMLSPTTVSLPFKLLLFVLIDGWAKLVHGLVLTYGVTT